MTTKSPIDCFVIRAPESRGGEILGAAASMDDVCKIAAKRPCSDPHKIYRVFSSGETRLFKGGYAERVIPTDEGVRAAGLEWIRAEGVRRLNLQQRES